MFLSVEIQPNEAINFNKAELKLPSSSYDPSILTFFLDYQREAAAYYDELL